jgi:hypothetical protein
MTLRTGPALRPLDRRRARVAARAISDKRRHARAPVALPARMLHEDGRENVCLITDISVGGLGAIAARAPRVNSRVVLVIDPLGRVEGSAVRVQGERFALRFEAMTERKRIRLADALTWELNRIPLELNDDRRARRRGKTGSAHIVFSDGVETMGDYIDVSDVGASFAAKAKPRQGEAAQVESRPARVARLHDRGFAVDFVSPGSAAGKGERSAAPSAEQD